MTKLRFFRGVFLASSFFILPASITAGTLVDAVRQGLTESPTVQKAVAESSISFHRIKEARADRLPQVTFDSSGGAAYRDRSIDGIATGTGSNLFSRDARLSIQQILLDFGASKALVDSADLQNQFHSILIEDVREQQALEISETFINLYRLRRQAVAVKNHINSLSDVKRLATENAEAGDTNSDALVITGRITNARSRLAEYEARIEALGDRYRLLTLMDPAGSMQILTKLPRSLKNEVNILKSPRVRAAELAVQVSEKNILAAKRDMAPKLFFEGRGGAGENVLGIEGSDNEWAALAVVRWTPYQGGRKQAVLSQQNGELEKDLAAKKEVIRTIQDEVTIAQSEINGAAKRRMISVDARRQLGEALGAYEESFDASAEGVGLLNIVNAQSEELTASIEAEDALYDGYIASVRGLSSGGELLRFYGIDGSNCGPHQK